MHTNILRSSALRTVTRANRPLNASAARITPILPRRNYAFQSYGGGEGDPKGENPQDQGPSTSSHLEHPGPTPPSGGKNSSDTSSSGSGAGSGSGSDSPSTSTSSKAGDAKPKIHSEENPGEANDDVKKHNEDMSNRHDKANEQSPQNEKDDKVGKGFWSGSGGADRDP